ncbi:MBL fold metallo-hydrolase [Candidatus Bathyarchaeota archaeon]|nr:MBL fold metallo-hydrolase [Candidatus Bathyarchaeota archaeon]
MEYQKVGTRGHLFTFNEPYLTNVYVINGKKHIIFLDTFLGPNAIIEIKKRLIEEEVYGKSFIVFNSHADYDHYWGNQEFVNDLIIAHDSAYKRIKAQGKQSLELYGKIKKGDVKITPPNLLFRKKIILTYDEVEFNYTPGHTGDSASCFDQVDKVLFVGDNLELPFPQVNLLNLKDWQSSLEEYLNINPSIIISGHDLPSNNLDILNKNLNYIKNLHSNKINYNNYSEDEKIKHFRNLRRIGGLYFEKGDKKKSKEYYNEALKVINDSLNTIENSSRKEKLLELVKKLT